MQKETTLTDTTLAVWGLGLMGGSLCMALKGKCKKLIGIDPDPEIIKLAKEKNLCDLAATTPQSVLSQANIIILAAPIHGILAQIEELPRYHQGQVMVMDLGSTKNVIQQKMEQLPANFDPIGGHPVCGKENSTLVNADAGLFQNAVFALTPLERTTDKTRSLAARIVKEVGANPLWIDAARHDEWISHSITLPYLAANLLAAVTPSETAPLVGPGFTSTTRLAVQSPEMMLDILTTNQEASLKVVNLLKEELLLFEKNLKSNNIQALEKQFRNGAEHKKNILKIKSGESL